MLLNIFHVDWIFWDTIIIIFLILLLIGVKIYKNSHRWRLSFSNEAINKHVYKNLEAEDLNINKSIKNWSLTENLNFKDEKLIKPTIILIRTNRKRRLLNILTEGLCSYGYNIITIRLTFPMRKIDNLSNKMILEDIRKIISLTIKYINQKVRYVNSKYIILNYSDPILLYISLLDDENNLGIIMVNPKINKTNLELYLNAQKKGNTKNQLHFVFSTKSNIAMKNLNQKRFLKKVLPKNEDNINYLTIEKARRSFKYYETILLSMIIDLIENKFLNI